MTDIRRRFQLSAILGALVWPAAFLLLPESDQRTIIAVLLFGPLVIVPLGLARLVPADPGRTAGEWAAVPYVQFLAAVVLAGAFVFPDQDSEWMSVPWLGVTVWVAGLRSRWPK